MRRISKIAAIALFSIMIISCGNMTYINAQTDTKSNSNDFKQVRDFSFGLSDRLKPLIGVEENDTGRVTFERFLEVKSELPEEIPSFEPYEIKGKNQFFVALNGNDLASGTIDKPFRTIERAIAEANSLKDKSGGTVIYIREGVYNFSDGLKIPQQTSGTAECPFIISSYNGENVEFVNGTFVNGSDLKPVSDAKGLKKLSDNAKNKVLTLNLKEFGQKSFSKIKVTGSVPRLIVDDIAFTLARWPNSTTVPFANYDGKDGTNGVIDPGPMVAQSNIGGFEFQMLNPRPLGWENTGDIWMYGAWYAEWYPGYNQIKNINADRRSISTVYSERYGQGAKYHKDNTYYYFNVLEELDVPGEWFVDNETGMLYIYPFEDMTDSQICYVGTDADVLTIEGSHVVVNGITIKNGNNYGVVIHGRNNIIQNCVVTNISKDGIWADSAVGCGVINNVVKNVGTNSINVRGGDNLPYPRYLDMTPTRNFIQNNIVDGGRIVIRNEIQSIISHNTVINAPDMCIYIGESSDCIIEFNEVAGGPHKVMDAGYIYVEGVAQCRGQHIRYNYVHDATLEIRQSPYGIYLDSSANGQYVYGNIVQQGFIFVHAGGENVVYNNVVLDSTKGSGSVTNANDMQELDLAFNYRKNFVSSFTRVNTNYNYMNETWNRRFPANKEFMNNFYKVREMNEPGKSSFNDFEKWFYAPKRNFYKNNVTFNGKPTRQVESEILSEYETNYHIESSDEFVDYENKNYNLKETSSVYDKISDFVKIPEQERMGAIFNEKFHSEKPKMTPMKSISPVNNPENGNSLKNIDFKFTPSFGAVYYILEIAQDINFENIVGEYKIKYSDFTLNDELEENTVYYWRVTAHTLSQGVEPTPVTMPVSCFRTYSREEAKKYVDLDLSEFEGTISNYRKIIDSILEDDGVDHGVGVYKQGTKQLLTELLNNAEKDVKEIVFDSELIEFTQKLYEEFYKELRENAIEYTRTYSKFNPENWNVYSLNNAGSLEITDKLLELSTETSTAMAIDNRMLTPKEKVAFTAKYSDIKNWDGFAIKQIDKERTLYNSNGYYIVVSPSTIELQKYPAKGSQIIYYVENNGIIKPDEWFDAVVGMEYTDKGIRLMLEINGQTVIDYVDEDEPLYDLGYFSIQNVMTSNKASYLKVK